MPHTKEADPSWKSWEACRLVPERISRAAEITRHKTTPQAFSRTAVHAFSEKHGIPTNRVYQVAWAIIVGSYAGTDVACSGFITLSAPNVPRIYRCDLANIASVVDTLNAVQEHELCSFPLPVTPWEALKQASNSGVFDTVLSIKNEPTNSTTEVEGDFLLQAQIIEADETIILDHPSPTISRAQAARMADCLKKTISEIINGSKRTLGELDILGDTSKETVLSWNNKSLKSCMATIGHLIEENVRSAPEAQAVCSWERNLTYGELDDISTRLAQHLRVLGITRNVIVPFLFHKSPWTIVAMLAIVKAGGAPTGLNPEFPLERLMYSINLTQASVILASAGLLDVIKDPSIVVVPVDPGFLSALPPKSPDFHACSLPRDIGFVLFTSGSTGQPKGIIIEHRAYCTAAFSQQNALRISNSSRVLEFAAHSFDAVLLEVFTTLIAGGCVCVPSEESRLNNLVGAINDMRVNWVGITPTLAKVLSPSDVPELRTLAVWGEPASKDVIDLWVDKVELLNVYGPAECSVIIAVNSFSRASRHPTNIGKALQAVNTWVVRTENHNKLAPVGAIGELLAQGPTIGSGYLHDKEKTAAAFVEGMPWLDSFSSAEFRKAYRTGDLVRYAEDGTLEYMGRKDTQVKLRGQRIELGEIEHHLNICSSNGAASAVAVINPAYRPTQQILVAFKWPSKANFQFLGTDKPLLVPFSKKVRSETAALERKLCTILPASMVPTIYFPLSFMPATPSGKVDRKMLCSLAASLSEAEMAAYALVRTEKTLPATDMERTFQRLWATLLDIDADSIGSNDNFFWLGGNSITAMRLTVAAREEGISITVADVLRHPLLSELASGANPIDLDEKAAYEPFSSLHVLDIQAFLRDVVCPQVGVAASDIEDVSEATDYQKSNVAWMMLKRRGGTNYVKFDFRDPVPSDDLENACRRLVAHHSILRTVFLVHRREVFQVVLKNYPVLLKHHMCSDSLDDATGEISATDMCKPIALGDPIVRFWFLHQENGVRRLIMRASYAQYDGHALIRLSKDLNPAYMGSALAQTSNFIDYMHSASTKQSQCSRRFWANLLEGSSMTKVLKHLRPAYDNFLDGAIREFIPTRSTQSHDDITAATTLKTAWAMTLAELSGETDVVFGSVTWGRNAPFPGVEKVVGPCIGHIPVRVQFRNGLTRLQLLKRVQEQYIAAIPFETLGMQHIIEECTNWRPWERMSSLVLYQNLDDSFDDLKIDENQFQVAEIRPPADRADITVYAQPSGSKTMVELNFCTKLFPTSFMKNLLDRLVCNVQKLSGDVIATLDLDTVVHPLIPFDAGLRPHKGQEHDGNLGEKVVGEQPNGVRKTPNMDLEHGRIENHTEGIEQVPNSSVVLTGVERGLSSAEDKAKQTGKCLKPSNNSENGISHSDRCVRPTPKTNAILQDYWALTRSRSTMEFEESYSEKTPFFEVWGDLVAAHDLASFYQKHGYDVCMEDVLDQAI